MLKRRLFIRSQKNLKGFTLSELLVVIILSGILFLFLSEGLDIICRYEHLVERSLYNKFEILDSHQTLESILEKADSIHAKNNELLFYTTEGNTIRVVIDSTRLLVYQNSTQADTLFKNVFAGLKFHSLPKTPASIDSLFLSLSMGKDTIRFSYGLSSETKRYLYINDSLNYAIR